MLRKIIYYCRKYSALRKFRKSIKPGDKVMVFDYCVTVQSIHEDGVLTFDSQQKEYDTFKFRDIYPCKKLETN